MDEGICDLPGLDFERLVDHLDQHPETIPNGWIKVINRTAGTVVLFQMDQHPVPKIRRSVRISCAKNPCGSGIILVPSLFVGDLGPINIEKLFGKPNISEILDLTLLLEMVGSDSINTLELVPVRAEGQLGGMKTSDPSTSGGERSNLGSCFHGSATPPAKVDITRMKASQVSVSSHSSEFLAQGAPLIGETRKTCDEPFDQQPSEFLKKRKSDPANPETILLDVNASGIKNGSTAAAENVLPSSQQSSIESAVMVIKKEEDTWDGASGSRIVLKQEDMSGDMVIKKEEDMDFKAGVAVKQESGDVSEANPNSVNPVEASVDEEEDDSLDEDEMSDEVGNSGDEKSDVTDEEELMEGEYDEDDYDDGMDYGDYGYGDIFGGLFGYGYAATHSQPLMKPRRIVQNKAALLDGKYSSPNDIIIGIFETSNGNKNSAFPQQVQALFRAAVEAVSWFKTKIQSDPNASWRLAIVTETWCLPNYMSKDGWVRNWLKNGWLTVGGNPVKYRRNCQDILDAVGNLDVDFFQLDESDVEQAEKQIRQPSKVV